MGRVSIFVEGYCEGKMVMGVELPTIEQAELMISRMKTQKYTSIRSQSDGLFARFFVSKVEFEIDTLEDRATYFIQLKKYVVEQH